MVDKLADCAVAYARQGIPVFPLKPRGKTPLTEQGFKDASANLATVEDWWRKWPDANIGIPTGKAFDVLDLDGQDALAAVKDWAAEHDCTPVEAIGERPRVQTGRGYHYLIAPTGIGNRAGLLPHVDYRGQGGYVVAPPSIHETGVIYTWQVPMNGTVPEATALLRSLIDPPKSPPDAGRPALPSPNGGTPYGERALADELLRMSRAPEGQRNDTLFRVAANVYELVEGRELAPSAMDEVRRTALATGLEQREVDRTLASVAERGCAPRTAPNDRLPAPRPGTWVAPLRSTPSPPAVQDADSDEDDDDESLLARLAPVQPEPAAWQGYPGWFVDRCDPWTEASPVATMTTLLAAFGCCIGPVPHLAIGNTRHPLLVWPLILGRTASGRKGTALGLVKSLLAHAEPAFALDNIASGLSSGEGLIYSIRDAEMNPMEAEESGKKNIDEGVADKRRLIVETEFASVLARAKREGNTLAAVLRQAWDGDNLSVLTKAAYKASRPHVGMIAHATPREFIKRLREEELAGGTYNRLLPIASRASKRLPDAPPVPEEVMRELGDELCPLIENARRTTQWIARTKAASDLWAEQLYDEFSGDNEDDDRVGQFVARAAPYCLRLSALYALLDGQTHIDVNHLQAGAALVRYSMKTVRHMYGLPVTATPLERKLFDALRKQGELTKAALWHVAGHSKTADELEQLLANIGAKSRQERTRGRPKTIYWMEESGEKSEPSI